MRIRLTLPRRDVPATEKGYQHVDWYKHHEQVARMVALQDIGWTPGTGTALKGAFTAYAGQTHGAAYDQTMQQALDDAQRDTSQRLLAIEQALRTVGKLDGDA